MFALFSKLCYCQFWNSKDQWYRHLIITELCLKVVRIYYNIEESLAEYLGTIPLLWNPEWRVVQHCASCCVAVLLNVRMYFMIRCSHHDNFWSVSSLMLQIISNTPPLAPGSICLIFWPMWIYVLEIKRLETIKTYLYWLAERFNVYINLNHSTDHWQQQLPGVQHLH